MDSSHFTDITCPWGVGWGQNVGLRDFCHIWLCCRRGHPCFTNTCLFFLWSTIENCWRSEAEGFTEARSAERGRVGEGVTSSCRWGSGGPPPGNFWKIASKWCILVHFKAEKYANFKTENLYKKKNCVCLRKDFILDLDNKIFWFYIYIYQFSLRPFLFILTAPV